MRKHGFWLAALLIAGACSSSKKKETREEIEVTRDKKEWIKDLPVEAGTTLQQQGRAQLIRFSEVREVKDAGASYWVAGSGYAKVNDGITDYFWNSTKAPHLEVTIESEQLLPKAGACRALFEEATGAAQRIELKGEGDFSAGMKNGKYLGVFRLKRATACSKF
jgi:hypothetical protein